MRGRAVTVGVGDGLRFVTALKQEVWMRMTVDLDDELLCQARLYAPGIATGALIEAALRAFIQIESARKLASAVGSQAPLVSPPRRKMS